MLLQYTKQDIEILCVSISFTLTGATICYIIIYFKTEIGSPSAKSP